jgi:hypothetical protein
VISKIVQKILIASYPANDSKKNGITRRQVEKFPPRLDEYISKNNPVREIDRYVGILDLKKLGFGKT